MARSTRLNEILSLGILLFVSAAISVAQCGQATSRQAGVSTLPLRSPLPKIAKRNSKDRVVAMGVLGCVHGPNRVRVTSEVMGCFLSDRVEPVYPAETENAKERLTLIVVVGKDGNVLDAKKMSGPENLAPAAIEAVKKWKYRPYLINGEPIEVDTTVELPTGMSSCVGVSRPFSVTSAPPSWLFHTQPVMPVLVSQGTPK
jgi:hypothetical protein